MKSAAAQPSPGQGAATASRERIFTGLYDAHHAAILAYCRRRTGSADAQDATAEVFTIAWRKLDDVPDGEKARSWLYGVAYRVLSHQFRSRRRRTRLRSRVAGLGDGVQPDPEAVVVQRAQDHELIDAAGRLRPRDQEILRLAGWEELPHDEIADILGISVAAVDQRFHRAKKRLAREYDRYHSHRPPTSAQEGGRA